MPLYIVSQQHRVPRRGGRQSILLRAWPERVWLVYGQAPLNPRGIWREVRECEYHAGAVSVWIASYDDRRVHYRLIRDGVELDSGVEALDDDALGHWLARAVAESVV